MTEAFYGEMVAIVTAHATHPGPVEDTVPDAEEQE